MAKPVVITLTVQTANLYGMNAPSKNQVDSCCTLSDDNSGRSSNGTLEDFKSFVFIDYNVKWVAVSNDRVYSVAIDSIVYKPETSDVNFFDNKGRIRKLVINSKEEGLHIPFAINAMHLQTTN